MTDPERYSSQEAASLLGISETILTRLSQYFKIPVISTQSGGNFAMFAADEITYGVEDVQFFQQVQNALIAGETLEAVKQRHLESIEVRSLADQVTPHFQDQLASVSEPRNLHEVLNVNRPPVIDVIAAENQPPEPVQQTVPPAAPDLVTAANANRETTTAEPPETFQENFWTRWANPALLPPLRMSAETEALLMHIDQELFGVSQAQSATQQQELPEETLHG